MQTFIFGIVILIAGYLLYSRYVESQFGTTDEKTPAVRINDGVDYIPLSEKKNMLIHLLNIAGLGPLLGAIQGILFGPIAFIIIPLGCILMGGVHDYFSGMLSVKNNGAQITELIRKYLGNTFYKIFLIIVSVLLLLLTTVFIYTSGDLIADKFFGLTEYSITNPILIIIYFFIALYFIVATLFPIDKIIGRFYPIFGLLLIIGTGLIFAGFITNGITLQNLDIHHLNTHPQGFHILPIFFITVSCGLLSGFHSTQSTIISRTIASEKSGKKIFYGMMCVESLITMIWAAGAMHVYSHNLVANNLIGKVNVLNTISDTFVLPVLTFVVTIAIVVLPVTSGGTAFRGLRMIIAEALNLSQIKMINRLKIVIPSALLMIGILIWAKTNSDGFFLIWRYFNLVNQMIAIPTFLYSTVYLYKNKKNYWITLLPGMFYIFITAFFILNSEIGFNFGYRLSEILAIIVVAISLIYMKLTRLKADK